MAKPTVTVTLNADDLDFVTHSISINVHCEDEMSDTERRTARKLRRAQNRLAETLKHVPRGALA